VAQEKTTGDAPEAPLPAEAPPVAEATAPGGTAELEPRPEITPDGADEGRSQAPSTVPPGPAEDPREPRASSRPSTAATQTAAPPTGLTSEDPIVGVADVEFLLNQPQQALSSIDEVEETLPSGVKRFELSDFSGTPASSEAATLDLVRDVELDVNIELGRTHMHLEDVLRLKKGSVVPLDKLAGDPVDIYVNDRLIARGEVLVLNDNFCVRVAELVVGDGPVRH
jgi:flagellar motor switch protein FliN/FliY